MLVEPLIQHAKQTPDEIAIIDDRGQHTYKQLCTMAGGMARHIAKSPDRPNIGLLLPAGAGFVASFYGTLLAGKCAVPINFLLSPGEMAHILQNSEIDTVITIPILAEKLKETGLKIIDLMELAKLAPMAALLPWPKVPEKSKDDLAVLLYTSATTGLPKGVMLTYGNLQSDVDSAIQHAGLQHKHRFLGVIPLFHSFGITAMMLAPIQLAATIIYMARFSAVGALNAVREHQVSLLFAVPSMFAAVAHLKSAGKEDFKSIYTMISGGEPLPQSLREKFFERFGVQICEGYGLTETSPVVALNTPHDYRIGSVGKMVPNAEAKIVDDNGSEVARNQSGEIWLRGPMIMKGYFKLPNETAAVFTPDGYFKTGDLGKMDDDGFLYITGRKKELIIIAGDKVSPRDIEDVLIRHPTVLDAAVVGKKDPARGEVVVAFVLAKEGQTISIDDLRNFCRDNGMPQWKIPREIFVETELPRSATGKVLKRVLAERVNAPPAA
jgi:long-chain acyl-CoA synthetase